MPMDFSTVLPSDIERKPLVDGAVMTMVPYAVQQGSVWWKPLCESVVHGTGWTLGPEMPIISGVPHLDFVPPLDLPRDEAARRAPQIADECAYLLAKGERIVKLSVEVLRRTESILEAIASQQSTIREEGMLALRRASEELNYAIVDLGPDRFAAVTQMVSQVGEAAMTTGAAQS